MSYRKLRRTSSQRKVMPRDITTDLIINERIVTIEARAKEVCSIVEKMITLGKRGDLYVRCQVATFVHNEVASARKEDESIVVESVLQKLFNDSGSCFVERQSGYTRILKIEPRHGDVIPMVVIEFVK